MKLIVVGLFFWAQSVIFCIKNLPIFFKHPYLIYIDFWLFIYYFFNFSQEKHLVEMKQACNKKGWSFNDDTSDFTYGETPYFTIRNILKSVSPTANDTFVDLGSGKGRCVLFAACYFGLEAVGVDMIPSFRILSSKVVNRLSLTSINLVESDFEAINFDNYSIIYICGTCFGKETWDIIHSKLGAVKTGTRVVSVTYSLQSSNLRMVSASVERFEWGLDKVYIYKCG